MKRLLLISNSTQFGREYLGHCAEDIQSFLHEVKNVLFVPYALKDLDGYAAKAISRFKELGFGMSSIHKAKNPKKAAEEAEAVFVGGGNTFRLLTNIYEKDLVKTLRKRVENGAPYIGSSAGVNLACPTIKTTNDMPIVFPPSFEALNLIPFQINPHYVDPNPNSKHMGETREQRIREFHEMNEVPVLGLREGAWLRIEDKAIRLRGEANARLFRKDHEAEEFGANSRLDFLMS